MANMVVVALFCATVIQQTLSMPLCGSEEFFEYKFRPIFVRPVNEADIADSGQRCREKKCDIVVSFMGETKCRNGTGVLMFAPKNSNEVTDFTPHSVGYNLYAELPIEPDDSDRMRVEVCDLGGVAPLGNDPLIDFEITDMIEGCQTLDQTDEHPEHPWKIKFQICCRPFSHSEA